jgi:periplasmic divalent cation tolerance protein
MSVRLLYITVPDRAEAESLGRYLVASRLVACVNIIGGVTSMYRWEGKVQSDSEVICIAKTTEAMVEEATRAIVERHSYEVPCVVALELTKGNAAFLQWIEDAVGPQSEDA